MSRRGALPRDQELDRLEYFRPLGRWSRVVVEPEEVLRQGSRGPLSSTWRAACGGGRCGRMRSLGSNSKSSQLPRTHTPASRRFVRPALPAGTRRARPLPTPLNGTLLGTPDLIVATATAPPRRRWRIAPDAARPRRNRPRRTARLGAHYKHGFARATEATIPAQTPTDQPHSPVPQNFPPDTAPAQPIRPSVQNDESRKTVSWNGPATPAPRKRRARRRGPPAGPSGIRLMAIGKSDDFQG